MSDFYEDDEDPAEIERIWARGPKGFTIAGGQLCDLATNGGYEVVLNADQARRLLEQLGEPRDEPPSAA